MFAFGALDLVFQY